MPAMTTDPASLFLPMKDLSVLVSEGYRDGLAWLSAEELQRFGSYSRVYLLGLLDGIAYHAVDVSGGGQELPALAAASTGTWTCGRPRSR